jgi:hypothetical protein
MDQLNEIISNTAPTLIVGRIFTDTDETQDIFDTKKQKMVKRRVRGSKTTKIYARIGSNRKIGGSNKPV